MKSIIKLRLRAAPTSKRPQRPRKAIIPQKAPARLLTKPVPTKTIPKVPAAKMEVSAEALLFGINYIGTPYRLTGCLNDALAMKNLLRQRIQIPLNKMSLYTDVSGMGSPRPTFATILNAIRAFSKSKAKSLYIYYSGHGSTVNDPEGKDSCLVSCDLQAVSDNYIMGGLVCQLAKDTTLVMVADSCNSGFLLDLPWSYTSATGLVQGAETPAAQSLPAITANVIVLCSCQIDQYSYETSGRGIMTTSLSDVLTKNKILTWKDVCDKLTASIAAKGYPMNPVINLSDPSLLNKPCLL